jgi:diguanylate cyclase (GGDEF)-like protein
MRAPLPVYTAAVAGAVCALVALAGAVFGPRAALLAVPAAAVTAVWRARSQQRAAALRRASLEDPLTRLANRRLLHERLDVELARVRRHGRPLTVVALDLDGFKAVNDRFGHPVGDEVLREVARALRRVVRAEDTVARTGGDEFVVLAPETGGAGARRLAARVEAAVAQASAGLEGLGASVGWAEARGDETVEELLYDADLAQVAVKRARRVDAGGRRFSSVRAAA